MPTPILQDFACTKVCLIPAKELQKEVGVNVRIPIGSSTKIPMGKFPIGTIPMNQMSNVGKNPMG